MTEATTTRLSTGIPELDRHLGGGLLPGTLTVVVGSTGIGKTQLGLAFANAGLAEEGHRGIVFDMNSRGDEQNQADYAQRMFGWNLAPADADEEVDLHGFFNPARSFGQYLRVFTAAGRRVSRNTLDFEDYQRWHAELQRKLGRTIAFFYGNFVRGVRRAVIDGIEPVEKSSDSIQLELFEYIYHQILRKDHDWLARDLFRQQFLANEAAVRQHAYPPQGITGMLLVTAHDHMLEALVDRPLDEGDLLATANTLVYMGKVREGMKFGRAIYIAKHRGSACSEDILPYRIDDAGLSML
jgi:KaiC/GvpD/RAD55 family RecA-like ATPase